MTQLALDLEEYIEIASGVYWVGFADTSVGLHCNPYLIVDGDEAVLLDSGSRDDFSTVMLKIMRTGTNPTSIQRLIYHHYDPDLCGNIPHMEALIQNPALKIISHYENNIFINYYTARSPKLCIEQMGLRYRFASGRELQFIRTPYSHSPGSFMTFDTQTKVLFSSDLFGSYDHNWSLYSELSAPCAQCDPMPLCPKTGKRCQMEGILDFHSRIMTSRKALHYALDRVAELDTALIAPQHGSLLHTAESRNAVLTQLRRLKDVGIDHFLEGQNR
ncbi:MAG: MBL fold metallo-hydrolase [Candidatus Limiplasma sp.]|nr:MBL fold metallo-hydrolase [Candidatus Limiplasma sp.]